MTSSQNIWPPGKESTSSSNFSTANIETDVPNQPLYFEAPTSQPCSPETHEQLEPGDDLGDELHAVAEVAVHPDDPDDLGYGIPEAEPHDPDLLPHLHAKDLVEKYFPRATVGENLDSVIADYEAPMKEQLHGPTLSVESRALLDGRRVRP